MESVCSGDPLSLAVMGMIGAPFAWRYALQTRQESVLADGVRPLGSLRFSFRNTTDDLDAIDSP